VQFFPFGAFQEKHMDLPEMISFQGAHFQRSFQTTGNNGLPFCQLKSYKILVSMCRHKRNKKYHCRSKIEIFMHIIDTLVGLD
jgi:hypothetical protein